MMRRVNLSRLDWSRPTSSVIDITNRFCALAVCPVDAYRRGELCAVSLWSKQYALRFYLKSMCCAIPEFVGRDAFVDVCGSVYGTLDLGLPESTENPDALCGRLCDAAERFVSGVNDVFGTRMRLVQYGSGAARVGRTCASVSR